MTLGMNNAKKLLLDDTIVVLYQYYNPMSGNLALSAWEDPRYDDTATSPFVQDRVTLKDRDGITEAGKQFLEGNS